MCCSTLTGLHNYRSYPFYVVCCGRDRMVVRCTTTYTISVYHYYGWEFESRSLQGVLDTALCDTENRTQLISRYLTQRPNILKFKQIMCTSEKIKLEKLCRFIRKINRSDILLANTLL